MAETEWWASRDEEFYSSGPYQFRTDAIDAGREDFDGDPFVIAEVTPRHLSLDAAELLDRQYYENEDLFCLEYSEPGWHTFDKSLQDGAMKALQAALDGWIKDYGHLLNQPNMFAATHRTESFGASYTIDEDDDDDGHDDEA